MLKQEINAIYKRLLSAYNRSLAATKHKTFIPACAEFAGYLRYNPLLRNLYIEMLATHKPLYDPFKNLVSQGLDEIANTKAFLTAYVTSEAYYVESKVHVASEHRLYDKLKQYEIIEPKRPKGSFELAYELNWLLKNSCDILVEENQDNKHADILSKLVKLDKNNNIIEYIFAPTASKLSIEYDCLTQEIKYTLAHSVNEIIKIYELYSIRERTQRKSLPKDDINSKYVLNVALMDQLILHDDIQDPFIDVEQCKLHLMHVWEFFEAGLDALIDAATG